MHTSICAINSAKSLTFAGGWVNGLHCSSEFYFGGSTVLHTFVGSYNHYHQPVRRQAVTRPRLSTLNILLYACGCSLTAAAASVARTYWRGTRRGTKTIWRRTAAVEEDLLSSLDLLSLSQEPLLPKFFLFFCTPQRICAASGILLVPPLLWMASNNQDVVVGVAADDDFNDDDADAFQSYYHG